MPNHLLASTLKLVITQDLVRKLCKSCRQQYAPTEKDKLIFKSFGLTAPDELYKSGSCDACGGHGRDGRTGVFQVGTLNNQLETAIEDGRHVDYLDEIIRQSWGESPAVDALKKVAAGTVAMEDIYLLPWLWNHT